MLVGVLGCISRTKRDADMRCYYLIVRSIELYIQLPPIYGAKLNKLRVNAKKQKVACFQADMLDFGDVSLNGFSYIFDMLWAFVWYITRFCCNLSWIKGGGQSLFPLDYKLFSLLLDLSRLVLTLKYTEEST